MFWVGQQGPTLLLPGGHSRLVRGGCWDLWSSAKRYTQRGMIANKAVTCFANRTRLYKSRWPPQPTSPPLPIGAITVTETSQRSSLAYSPAWPLHPAALHAGAGAGGAGGCGTSWGKQIMSDGEGMERKRHSFYDHIISSSPRAAANASAAAMAKNYFISLLQID